MDVGSAGAMTIKPYIRSRRITSCDSIGSQGRQRGRRSRHGDPQSTPGPFESGFSYGTAKSAMHRLDRRTRSPSLYAPEFVAAFRLAATNFGAVCGRPSAWSSARASPAFVACLSLVSRRALSAKLV